MTETGQTDADVTRCWRCGWPCLTNKGSVH